MQCIVTQCMSAMHDSMLTCCWRLLRPTQRGWAATLQPLHLIRPDPCLHSRHLDLAFSPMSFTKPQKSCKNRKNIKFGLWSQHVYSLGASQPSEWHLSSKLQGPTSRCSLVTSCVARRYPVGTYLKGCKTTVVKWGHSAEGQCRILPCA